jgi:Flp pilus assembly protein TadB
LEISDEVPASSEMKRTAARQSLLQRRLWGLAGEALEAQPTESGTRLYVDSLNNMIDQQTVRIAALSNRVPGAVLGLEVIAGAVAVGLLALYLAVLGRGLVAVISAAVLVTLLLLVTFDLDRPTRGLIKIPATPLESVRASMIPPPAAGGG